MEQSPQAGSRPHGAVMAALAVSAAIGASGAAAAQTAGASSTQVEEVVVTAQRVQENLQQVPVAVTAFGAEQLRRNNIESLADIALRTPGFTAGQANPVSGNFAIRGIGSAEGISQNAGGDPSVVVFVDGVYAGRGGTPDIDSFDLDRVEVLRGPQGTLFGKNAVGGLIQFVSRKPSSDPSLRVEGTVGNYSRFALNARANIPLSDKVFISFGLSGKQRDGYEFNETTKNYVDDEKLWTAQGQLRWVPNDTVDVTLGVDLTHQDQAGQPRHNICDATFAGGVHCVGVNPDPRVVDAWTDGYVRRDLQTYRAEVNWRTPIGTLTSLTAFRDVKLGLLTPFFSNPVNPPNQIESTETDRERDNQFSQELRLAFDALDKRLTGQVGLYYLREENDRVEELNQQFPTPAATGVATYPQNVTGTSFAVFGQFGWKLTDSLTATAGARMTWEDKDGHFIGRKVSGPGLPPPLAADYDVTASKSWEAFTPRFALDWQATANALIYASATRGFKSGGFQGIAGSAASQSTPYNPEFAWSYEGGAKTQWLDNRLRLNLSIFQTNYEDLQVSQLVPLCCVVVGNAATARIRGAELEFLLRPASGWQIDGNYAYLDAKFTDFAAGAAANYTGNVLPRSPKNKVNLGLQHTFPIAGWRGLARVDYSWQSKIYFEASNDPHQSQEAYSNLDARLAFDSPDGSWNVAVWGKNLTDELVKTYVTYFGPYRQTLVPYAPPLTFGVTLSFKH